MKLRKTFNRIIVTMFSVVFLVGCSAIPMSESPVKTASNEEVGQVIELTLDELKEFDGLEGQKAYIAVDGKIYDVTDVEPWAGGVHFGKYAAGADYSEQIKSESPHGLTPLNDLEPIGILIK